MKKKSFNKRIISIMFISIYVLISFCLIFSITFIKKYIERKQISDFKNKIQKIKIIETATGKRSEQETSDILGISQINDIFIDIADNNDIKEVIIKSAKITKKPEIGNIKVFLSSGNNDELFDEEKNNKNILEDKDILIHFGNDTENIEQQKYKRLAIRVKNESILEKEISKSDIVQYNLGLLNDPNISIEKLNFSIEIEMVIVNKENKKILTKIPFKLPNSINSNDINSYVLDTTKIKYVVEKSA